MKQFLTVFSLFLLLSRLPVLVPLLFLRFLPVRGPALVRGVVPIGAGRGVGSDLRQQDLFGDSTGTNRGEEKREAGLIKGGVLQMPAPCRSRTRSTDGTRFSGNLVNNNDFTW